LLGAFLFNQVYYFFGSNYYRLALSDFLVYFLNRFCLYLSIYNVKYYIEIYPESQVEEDFSYKL